MTTCTSGRAGSKIPYRRFSKVSALVYLLCKTTILRTFENGARLEALARPFVRECKAVDLAAGLLYYMYV
jgi:hypothetical protein